jgi:hypothetical protein
MATLLELERQGFLVRYDPELEARVLEQRQIYLSKVAEKWLDKVLPNLESQWDLTESPLEQVDDLLAKFCSGSALSHGRQFHVMHPIAQGIWELKTADVRMFGWFVAKDCFLIGNCESASRLKSANPNQASVYARNVAAAAGFRQILNLDEPKFLEGSDPNVVVST